MSGEALRGLRIIELAEVWAGPFGCSLLGDLGAEVIKLESYPRTSTTRPLTVPDARVADGPGPVYERANTHHHGNRNKRNIAVDIRRPEGAEVLRRLVRRADVLVESFSAGTIGRLGFGWEAVHALNPRLTMISLAGWGQEGPYQGYVMYGAGFEAMSGLASVRGYPGAPVEELIPTLHSDSTVPLALIFAVVTAAIRREESGEGSYVDLAQIEELATQIPGVLGEWTLNGRVPPRLGNADPHVVPHGCYRAGSGDGWVAIAAETDEQWAGLARAMGHAEWAADGHPWASLPGRLRDREAVDRAVGEWAQGGEPYEIADRVQAAGAIGAPANPPEGPLYSPQLHERGWFQSVDHPYLPNRLLGGFLWRLAPDGPSWDLRCGLLGEHNREVLLELGYADAEVGALAESDVIGDRYPDPPPPGREG